MMGRGIGLCMMSYRFLYREILWLCSYIQTSMLWAVSMDCIFGASPASVTLSFDDLGGLMTNG